MEKYFSVGEAAKSINITSETLRHYDRIGLVHPSKKDEQTNYRYYTEQDLVRINTIRALQQMDLPLQKIKEVLAYNNLEKIIDFLTATEKKADEKIARLQHSKAKIQLARSGYENQFNGQQHTDEITIKQFSKRVIMLSDTLETPTLDSLWNYLSHFYNKIPPSQKGQFEFEDSAGVYTKDKSSRLFATCLRYPDTNGLTVLPQGRYLCSYCTEETRASKLSELTQIATDKYHASNEFTLQQIIISGILQWNYQLQIYIDE